MSIGVKSRVGFVVGQSGDGSKLFILGGNQSDEANISQYKKNAFTSFIAPEGSKLSEAPLYIGKKNENSKES